MLATLFKDERCSQLSTHSILEKMYLDQIIRKKDLVEFEAVLMEHQKAVTSDGRCIFSYAMIVSMLFYVTNLAFLYSIIFYVGVCGGVCRGVCGDACGGASEVLFSFILLTCY